jgi:tetratricopeptide (TPR) repeat protein
MGPFAVDRNSTLARQTVPRATAAGTPKEKGRRGTRPPGTGNFLPNAQQPKPRRNANEFFEFGKAQDRSSPQLLNFGGAFSRPAQHSGFAAPLAGQQPDSFSIGLSGSVPQQPLFSTHSFDSHQSGTTAPSPIDPFFQPYRLASPSPTMQGQGQIASSYRATTPHHSDMHVSAPEFVPMVTRATPSPALMGPLTQQWVHVPMHAAAPAQQQGRYDRQPHDQGGWHPAPSAYRPFGGPSSYGYAMSDMQTPAVVGETRSAMTPSPHLPPAVWQHQLQRADASASPYGTGGGGTATTAASNRGAEAGSSSFVSNVASSGMAGHFGVMSAAGSALSSTTGTDASLRLRREARRGKRSTKKKAPQVQNEATPEAALLPDAALPSVAPITTSQVADLRRSQQSPSVFSSLPAKLKKSEPRPASAMDGRTEEVTSALEDPIDPKRIELDESPATRLIFKEFYKSYRLQERLGLQYAEDFAKRSLQDGSLPESVHWRVYIELADIARRSNRFVEARHLYQKVCQLQPYASQGWIEYSKLEEECGYMNRVTNILHAGLEYCEYNENLLIRTVKHHERMGNLDQARAILARLKHVGIDKVWRTMLEGASLEARAGNIGMARKVLQYIMHYVPWYGPLYVEFYRLQRDYGRPVDAMSIVELGLTQIPRYGPLWFAALRVCEELDFADKNFALPKTTAMLQRASANVSKEIAWKVHLEASFIFERAAQEQAQASDDELDSYLGPARRYFALTISTCRLNLRWKVWLAAARIELYAGNKDISRTLFLRAHEVAPEKVRSLTYLDFARLHEFVGEINLARALLCKGCYYYGHDWKVWLERVLLETRGYNHKKAFEVAKRALEIHPGTGRLWSALVQLSYFVGGDNAQYAALRDALNAVPKSGEVWCEGARIHLNPFSDLFDIERARRHLHFAEKFTPQYGDTFLEAVRLELLDQWMDPIADMIWAKTKNSFISTSKSSKNQDWLTKFITDVTLAVSCARHSNEEAKNFPGLSHETIIPNVRGKLFAESTLTKVDFSTIVMACSNADPNYGPLWFNCRQVQTDPPRCVVEQAAKVMLEELRSQAHVYLAAMVRRRAVLSTIASDKPRGADRRKAAAGTGSGHAVEVLDLEHMEWEDRADSLLRASPSLRDIFNPVDPTTGLVLLQSTINGSDFVTGLMDFNRRRPIEAMSFSDRRRAIFATDALFP